MQLFYRLSADLIVIVHFGVATYIVLGLILTLIGAFREWAWIRNFWFRAVHLSGIVFIVCQTWLGETCPLTTWEKQLAELGGQMTYQGDFIPHMLNDLLFFTFPAWVFTLCYTIFGASVLLTFLLAPPRLKRVAKAGMIRK